MGRVIGDDGVRSKPGVLKLTLTSGPTQPILELRRLRGGHNAWQSCSEKISL